MSGGFSESGFPDDDYKLPDIDISVAHQARVYDYLPGIRSRPAMLPTGSNGDAVGFNVAGSY